MPGIPPEELLRYFSEAAEALDFLHQQKLSHRDIKPQNLLHLKGHAKVADFGIARQQQSALDHTLNIGGTPAYMAPEMWRGEISVHSDQYSLALTWYEMRTCRRPFSATNQVDLLQQHIFQKPDLSGVPEAEQAVLLRALAKTPDQRFPTCEAFVQALGEALKPPKPEIAAQPPAAQVPVRALVFAMIAVLLTLGVVWWRWPSQPPSSTPRPEVSWLPPNGWEPEDSTDIIADGTGNKYFRHWVRMVDGQKVVLVVVLQMAPDEERTFYIMGNKVWNGLYAAFVADPKAKTLMEKYSSGPGCDRLVQRNWRTEWRKGGYAPNRNPDWNKEPFFGVDGKEQLPVFRVTVTEAHCFARWLGGRLPSDKQWRKAAGLHEDSRPGPFDPDDKEIAVGLVDGPWPVQKGRGDRSIYGCRQMASNGREWTRDVADRLPNEKLEIPLDRMNGTLQVVVQGQSYYQSTEPLTFETMQERRAEKCTAAYPDLTFRIVVDR